MTSGDIKYGVPVAVIIREDVQIVWRRFDAPKSPSFTLPVAVSRRMLAPKQKMIYYIFLESQFFVLSMAFYFSNLVLGLQEIYLKTDTAKIVITRIHRN